jgi:serine/threonine protein kinase
MLSPGSRLAQYEVTGRLGTGGMGEVYRARDLRLARDVAIKVMADHIAADPGMRERFETEARAVAALSHPSIMSIHELGIADGRPFAVMELLEGQTLRKRIETGALPWRDAVKAGIDVAEGLAAAHTKGVIHRDLKPENVFITTDGQVKILDFGLALHRVNVMDGEGVTGMRTAPGLVLGTFGYMSPEQVLGERVDGRSDLFAAGCLLYEMLTGRRLFHGGTPNEMVASLLRTGIPDLSALDSTGPPELRTIVSRCVERDPARRFASASDLAMALRTLFTTSVERTGSATRRPRTRGKSLAVLPFINSGADPQIEYLTDGITESIINSLSQLPGLRVVPRSLVFRYKGMQADPATIGLALNARTILTGHVAQHGEMLQIQAELVDTATESQLWGERFRQNASELLSLQEEIAWQISEALRLKLTGEQKKKLRKRATVNPEAYQEYLRGQHHWHHWSPENFSKAISHFERALMHDPEYALAYAGLAYAIGAQAYYGIVRPSEGFPRSRAAALKALELDSRLADAYVAIGLERFFWGWDWAESWKALEKAVSLAPDLALAHAIRSLWLISTRQFDDAAVAATRARALDPLSPFINMGMAWVHHFAGNHAAAIREVEDVLALRPGLTEGWNVLISSYESLGKFEEAAAVIEKHPHYGIKMSGTSLLDAYHSGGAQAYWRARLEQMSGAQAPVFANFAYATIHAHLGDFDRAIDYLEAMVDAHAGGSVFIGVEGCIRSMRGIPRFDALLRRIGVPQPQMA